MDILNLPMLENDAGAATIGDYLRELLKLVWLEGEGFSGKRPFGNSSWEYEIYIALVSAGAVHGTTDRDGDFELDDHNIQLANQLIVDAISGMG